MLTIIALVLGGIVVGQSLLRNAQLRAVVDEEQRYTQAMSNFRDKYLALPGDFTGATALWGSFTSVPSNAFDPAWTCFDDWVTDLTTGVGSGTKTCDGDGDGEIYSTSDNTGINGCTGNIWGYCSRPESYLAWQHLLLAGMIDGYNAALGLTASSTYPALPHSKLDGSMWCIETATFGDATSWTGAVVSGYAFLGLTYVQGDVPYNTFLYLTSTGSTRACIGSNSISNIVIPVLTTGEALSIDQKIDDGMPTTGKVTSAPHNYLTGAASVCANGATPPIYDFTQTGFQCNLIFKTGL